MITIQILSRLQKLHELGFTHGDMKLQNILVDLKDSNKIYLIDFGLTEKNL